MRGDELSIPTPCAEDWNAMTKVEGGRHCERCAHAVVDLSLLTDAEVRALIDRTDKARVCVSARFRPDGTLVTQDYFRAHTCTPAQVIATPPGGNVYLGRRLVPPGNFVPVTALRRAPHDRGLSTASAVSQRPSRGRGVGPRNVGARAWSLQAASGAFAGAGIAVLLAACAPHGGIDELAPIDPMSESDIATPQLAVDEVTLPIAPATPADSVHETPSVGEGDTPCDPQDSDLLDAADAQDEGKLGGTGRKVPLRGVVRRSPPPPEPHETRTLGLEG